jgi:hypothetical protein
MGTKSTRATPAKKKAKRAPRASTLQPGHDGKILDKLLLLEKVIPRHEVLQVLHDTGCLDARSCTLTFEVTCWVVLAMGVLTGLPIRAVFQASRCLYQGEEAPHRSALSVARQRLGIPPSGACSSASADPWPAPTPRAPSTAACA